ncbi:MAG: ABC transporter substrate-binding protein [Holosporales bacterium]|jgi:phospholipid transport system substrate-binding protein|nr:ABC transporter substrate-binding protein [Holosporales bacterium]
MNLFKKAFWGLGVCWILLGGEPAFAEPAAPSVDKAQTMIRDFGSRAIKALTDPAITVPERQKRFATLLEEGFDVSTIARFVLGRHWRRLTEPQQERFIALLRKMIVVNYAARFREFAGVLMQVKGAEPAAQGGVNVTSLITPPRSGPVKVVWKMFPASEGAHGFKIVDVVIDSVSMSVTQRSEFASVIQRLGDNLESFLSDLGTRVQRAFEFQNKGGKT